MNESTLTPEDQQIIREELQMLQFISGEYLKKQTTSKFVDYDRQALELRDSLAEARDDDVAGYIAQLSQTEAISKIRNQIGEKPIDLKNPYFGHFHFISNQKKYHAFLGNSVFRISSKNIMVLDWRNSPVSALYYLYGEGEEFEEEIAGQIWEGMLYYKRSLSFKDGNLIMIKTGENVLYKEGDEWFKTEHKIQTLSGGQFSAIRPENFVSGGNTKTPMHKLGETTDIASFLSKEQYEILTQPPEGALLIRGVAGSGKTTVALQRLLWLISNPKFANRHLPIAVFVPNKALIRYIQKILQNLKIENVKVTDWDYHLQNLFRSNFPDASQIEIKDAGNFSLMALKRHPGMLSHIRNKIEEKKSSWNSFISEVNQKYGIDFSKIAEISDSLLYLEKTQKLAEICSEKSRFKYPQLDKFPGLLADAKRYLLKEAPYSKIADNLLSFWEDWMTATQSIRAEIEKKQTGEFKAQNLKEALKFLQEQFSGVRSGAKGKIEEIDDELVENEENFELSVSDLRAEDLSILLYAMVRLMGSPQMKGKPILYRHVLADEGQELSLFDLHLIFSFCAKPQSLTIAGDINQSSGIYLTTEGWDEFIRELKIPLNRAPMLNTGYRSTAQIMKLGAQILSNAVDPSKIKALKQGFAPIFHQLPGLGEQTEFLQTILKELMHKEPRAYCAVLFQNLKEAKSYFDIMKKFDVPKINFVSEDEYSFDSGIEFTEIQNAKGLEFDYVILMNIDAARYPDYPYNRRLLYLGVTRAISQLRIINHTSPASILPSDLAISK